MAHSICNTVTARPGTSDADTIKSQAIVTAGGFSGARLDCSFESVFATTTVASADYSGVDRFITKARAENREHAQISIGPYVSTGAASWTALLGTYGSAARLIKKRPPAGTANAGWDKIIECLNALLAHCKTAWVNAGGDASKLHFQIWQEWGIGASDGPSTADTVGGSNALADMIAAGHEGKVCTDALWDTMAGVNAGYANVRGVQDFAEYVFPRIVWPSGCQWTLPAMENQGTTVAAAERASYFGGGYTWWLSPLAATGFLDVDIHNYHFQQYLRASKNPLDAARLGADEGFYLPREALKALYPSILLVATTRWHSTEYGCSLTDAFGTSTDNGTWTHQQYGDHLCAIVDVMTHLTNVETVGFEEAFADAVLAYELYSTCNLAGNTSMSIAGIARGNNAHVDITVGAPTWGGSWIKTAAEVPI